LAFLSGMTVSSLLMINIRALMDGHAFPDRVLPPGASFSKAS